MPEMTEDSPEEIAEREAAARDAGLEEAAKYADVENVSHVADRRIVDAQLLQNRRVAAGIRALKRKST